MIRNLPPLPWTVTRDSKGGYATVTDAAGQGVIGLVDVELGWTDTATGPYVDPDQCYAELEAIVRVVNGTPALIAAAKGAADALDRINIGASDIIRQIRRVDAALDTIGDDTPDTANRNGRGTIPPARSGQ